MCIHVFDPLTNILSKVVRIIKFKTMGNCVEAVQTSQRRDSQINMTRLKKTNQKSGAKFEAKK